MRIVRLDISLRRHALANLFRAGVETKSRRRCHHRAELICMGSQLR
jgi:hypothetical protein